MSVLISKGIEPCIQANRFPKQIYFFPPYHTPPPPPDNCRRKKNDLSEFFFRRAWGEKVKESKNENKSMRTLYKKKSPLNP